MKISRNSLIVGIKSKSMSVSSGTRVSDESRLLGDPRINSKLEQENREDDVEVEARHIGKRNQADAMDCKSEFLEKAWEKFRNDFEEIEHFAMTYCM